MLELQTFGGLELHREDGEPVEALSGRIKCLALLAYLAVEAADGRLPREEVAALLWPNRPEERARESLRSTLYQLRHLADSGLVAGKGASKIGLAGDQVRADVTLFRQALEAGEQARALELYEGDFLAGVHLQGARRFQRWADRQRGRYRDQAYEAALSVGSRARASGDLATAEVAFRRALDLAPLREEAARALISTLAERGRSADALQLYEAFRQRRQEELEMAPSEELDELVDELKQAPPAVSDGDEAAEPAVEATAAGPGGASGDREPTEDIQQAGRLSTEESDGVSSGASGDPTGPEPVRWGRFRRRTWLGALAAVGLTGGLLAATWQLLGTGGEAAPETTATRVTTTAPAASTARDTAGPPRIAVLPFENIARDTDDAFFARGIHGEVLDQLSKVSGLRVISRTSVMQYADTDKPVPAISEDLGGVNALLEGTVRRAGNQVRITTQLISAPEDEHLWSNTYEREVSPEAIFDIQADIAEQIAGALKIELTASERTRIATAPTEDRAAYEAYLTGRALRDRDEADAAAVQIERAIEIDSTFAPAWVELARLRADEGYFGTGGSEALREAMRLTRRALELDGDLAAAHAQLGQLHWQLDLDVAAAERELRRAVELDPGSAEARTTYGRLLAARGRFEEALDLFRAARRLDPLDPDRTVGLAWAHATARNYREMLRWTEQALKMDPDNRRARLWRAAAYLGQGRAQKAVREFERLGSPPGPVGKVYLIRAYVAAGRREDAERIAEEIISEEEHGDLSPYWAAGAHAALGNEEAALDLLEKAYEQRRGQLVFLEVSPYWDGMRDHPRFRELVRRLELE